MKPPYLDLVFEGGGAKGAAYAGVLQALDSKGFTQHPTITGTSAGAITAALRACGANAGVMLDWVIEKAGGQPRFASFLDLDHSPITAEHRELSPTFRALRSRMPRFVATALFNLIMSRRDARAAHEMVVEGGAFEGEVFESWLIEKIGLLGWRNPDTLTLYDLYWETGTLLTVVATNLRTGEAIGLNAKSRPRLPVVKAVRMSMSIPLLWKPIRWESAWGVGPDLDLVEGDLIADGGLRDNFPMDRARRLASPRSPVGFLLAEDLRFDHGLVERDERGPLQQYPSLEVVSSMLSMWLGNRGGAFLGEGVVVLPAKGVGTAEFDAPPEKLLKLIGRSRSITESWLNARQR